MNNLNSLREWISPPNTDQLPLNKALYAFITHLFGNSQDGICLLDESLNIIYVNNTMSKWYGYKDSFTGRKCFEIYHCKDRPCENCPTLKAIKSKKIYHSIVPYETKYSHNGNQKLTAFPILSNERKISAVIEHIQYLSNTKKEKEALATLNNKLNEYSQKMLEQNIALRVLGAQLSQDSEMVLNEISMKIDSLIMPLLDSIKLSVGMEKEKKYLTRITKHIKELTKPFLSKLPLDRLNLTPREIQVATYIREGFTSKEIGDMLFISKKTVDFHRANLRKKFALNDKQSLQTYLLYLGAR
jgi:DNA-binding CsgD family transcriptional regulator